MRSLKKALLHFFVALAALIVWIEEWMWELVKVLSAIITHLPPLRWYEATLLRLPPYPALATFLIPGALLLPVKIGALWLMKHGQGALGIGVIVAAKVTGTAIVTRSFVLCKDKLMTIHWFAWIYNNFYRLRNWLFTRVQAMPTYKLVRRLLARVRVLTTSSLRRIKRRFIQWRQRP